MEDKQLDFNQPLLSARRYTSPARRPESGSKKKTGNSVPKTPRPPIYKSELKSGPVRNPGTVPFVWEKTPGRPKEERNLQTQVVKQPPIVPKLPPGRVLNDNRHSSRQGCDGKSSSSYQNVSSSNKDETKYESSNEEMAEIGSSCSLDSDEAYVDALDTLSMTESFFFNCSVSGVSGLDGPEIMSSGIFSRDPQTQDFMMDRFLPAAKAVASGTPPYASRKQPVVREPQIETKKLVFVNKQQPTNVSSSQNNFLNHAQGCWREGSDDEDDYSQSETSSAKVCGIFPQFLLKNSFCLLNPLPGMKIQASRQVNPAHSVRRRLAKSPYLRSGNDAQVEHAKAAAEKGLTGISQIEELTGDKISYISNFQKPDGASLFRRLQDNDISSHPNQISQMVQKEKGFLGIPEKDKKHGVSRIHQLENGSKNFQELLAIDNIKLESASDGPVVEKTLYVDSVHKVISSDSSFSDTTALAQRMEDDSRILKKVGEMKETLSSQDVMHLKNAGDGKMAIVQHKSLELLDSYSPEKYATDMQLDATSRRRDQDLIQYSGKSCLNVIANRKDDIDSQFRFKLSCRETSHGLIQDAITVTKPDVAEQRKIGLEGHLQKKSSSNQESSHGSYLTLPLALPLPKAPSESWLKRTLPTVSSRNSLRSCLVTSNHIGAQASPAPTGDPKWETIVRSSNVHHGHLRFSQEQLPPIPEA